MQTANIAPSAVPARPAGRGFNIALWIVQVVIALMFLMAGVSKATQPIAELAKNLVWPGAIPEGLVRFIGVSELLGGLGLLLPSLTRIKPWLTPLAAAGLVTIMALAIPFHASRGEFTGIVVNLVLGSAAAFVAWGRFKKAPIAPRGR